MAHCSSSVSVDGPTLPSGAKAHPVGLISSPSLPPLLTTYLGRSYHLYLQDLQEFVILSWPTYSRPAFCPGFSVVSRPLHFCLPPIYISLCFVFSHSYVFYLLVSPCSRYFLLSSSSLIFFFRYV